MLKSRAFKNKLYMKKLLIIASLLLATLNASAQVNITPLPAIATESEGTFSVKTNEVNSWLVAPNVVPTGKISKHLKTTVSPEFTDLGEEGYRLKVNKKGVVIESATEAGRYYALQSLRQLLPREVVLGNYGEKKVNLPFVEITDQPRFAYRGFMLDVSRHFHPVSEIKRMIDLMAMYKMNRFHWHLTDDDGWRAEIKKYPKLTTIGATSDSCRMNDMEKGLYYVKNYGPYFYTQEEMRDVVAYAKARHIEVVPEVDMPGHFCAAMAAYPEFSCEPEGAHAVIDGHGGIYEDILNVANPKAVQFAKDVLDELCDIFPYPYIHIGGDECPTAGWERNAECQKVIAEQGLTSPRQLQQRFIKEMSDFVKTKGKRLYVWNETITEDGSDQKLMQETEATIFSWYPSKKAARLAADLHMPTVVSDIHHQTGSYYINRRPSADEGEPLGAGKGDDTVEKTYTYVPVPEDLPAELEQYYIGVQATFWCEWVSDSRYLEYLTLPKLQAVAEAGWTPERKKSWADFKRRMLLDTPVWDALGYNYSKHWMK